MAFGLLRRLRERKATQEKAEPAAPERPRPRPTTPSPLMPETNLTLFFWRKR